MIRYKSILKLLEYKAQSRWFWKQCWKIYFCYNLIYNWLNDLILCLIIQVFVFLLSNHLQISHIKHGPTWTYIDKHEQTWYNMDQQHSKLISLIQHGTTMTNLTKMDKNEPTWTHLDLHEKIKRNLDKHWHPWPKMAGHEPKSTF